ncbi:MAG: DUF3667 domain-containing protein [Cyclobacteriaceae bacterium]|nr:DUF3667 domain-containing protein [Cyclobacteriaceae bacterium]
MPFSLFKRKEDTFNLEVVHTCKTCHFEFKGRYCGKCGEKVMEENERSIQSFLAGLLNAFTFLDGKFIRTLKLLLTKPGQLSRNITDGIRMPYMSLISLFFVANFFYFLFPLWDSFNSSLYSQMNVLPYHERAARMVNEKIEKEKITLELFTEKYTAQSTNLSKLLLILVVIMFSFALFAVNFSKKAYFFDHLLFSLEFNTFHILFNLIIFPTILIGLIKFVHLFGVDWGVILNDNVYFIIVASFLACFLFFGQINFYKQKWYWGLLRVAPLFFLFTLIIGLYRAMLFYFTMWTI